MFKSDNIAFSAFLIHKGCKFLSVKRVKNRIWWHFELEESKASELYSRWLSSEENSFFSKYMSLKSDIKSVKKSK